MTTKKKPTPTEVSRSLTGFDEIAIKQKFGASLGRLREDPTQFLRALNFTLLRRDGKNDAEAYSLAQTATLGDVSDRFSPEPEDKDPEADFNSPQPTTTP